MKAFKKWWFAQSQTKYYEELCAEELCAEEGWRAALEWAKRDDDLCIGQGLGCGVIYMIEQELENKS